MHKRIKEGRFIFYPYQLYSDSCSNIAASLRSKSERKTFRVRASGNYHPRTNDIIINWGNSEMPKWGEQMLNNPRSVSKAINKLKTLQVLFDHGVSHVYFTTDRKVACEWGKSHLIVCRHKLEGHSGDGIEIIEKGASVPNSPLYTRFIPKSSEYRVHVFKGKIIDYTKKIKRTDEGIVSRIKGDRIRSNTLGWEFIRDVAPRESVSDLAIAAVDALGLDFGAVDIIRSNKVNYVLEVGTAPGLSPIGIESYSRAILDLERSN